MDDDEQIVAIEPKLVLRGLRITFPGESPGLNVIANGLAGTESEVSFCDFVFGGPPGFIKIEANGRIVKASQL